MKVFYEGSVIHKFNPTLCRDFTVHDNNEHLIWELTQGKSSLVDYCDYEAIKAYVWRSQESRWGHYALTGRNKDVAAMHTLIGVATDYQVDHKSRDSLDNRRLNLRFATREQQMFNRVLVRENESCEYRGVQLRKDRDLYRVAVRKLGATRSTNLCHRTCPVQAAKDWDEFMYEEYKGEFPLKGYESNGLVGEPTINFIHFNFPERLGL